MHDATLSGASLQVTLPEQVASQAQFLVDNLRETTYRHVEQIDVDRGIYNCDCNGYVSFVLERSAPDHYAMIPKEATQLRPRAFEYYVFFSSLTPTSTGGWHRIDRLADARRGDVLAWRFPTVEKGHDTGHVVLLADTPVPDGSGLWKVRVYDSSAEPHFADTRGTGAGQSPTGVGSGFLHFKTDALGRPVSFQFAPADGFVTLPIAIGRVEELPPV